MRLLNITCAGLVATAICTLAIAAEPIRNPSADKSFSHTPDSKVNNAPRLSGNQPGQDLNIAGPQSKPRATAQAAQRSRAYMAARPIYPPYTNYPRPEYNPYPYGYGYGGYGYNPWWGYPTVSGGRVYAIPVPNPYAFGSAVTYGYSVPGGYYYGYGW